MIGYLLLTPVGYLLGSLPFGILAGWLVKRVDIRDYGSGKTGMTNVLRTIGAPAAVAVLLLDMGKVILAVTLARVFFDSPGIEAATALGAVVGHCWPVFVGFRGGRGTAPGLGGLLILSPLAGLIVIVIALPLIAVTRYVSAGSLVGAALGGLILVVLSSIGHAPLEYIWFGVVGSLLILARHKDNILRLVSGQERKLGKAAEGTSNGARRGKGMRWPRSA